MMQKNEDKLLEAWLRYYSDLFGVENLTVIDNGSIDKRCSDTLAHYERLGLRVLREHSTTQDFIDKGEIIGALIKAMDRAGEAYDMALALDCDEFMVAINNRVSFDKALIHEELRKLCGQRRPVVLTELLNNVPGHGGWFTCEHVPKAIVPADTLEHLDHGFHHPKSKYRGATFTTARLGHVHLHNRELTDMRKFARQKLAPFLDVDDLTAVSGWGGSGHHLTKYFVVSEEEWSASFMKRPLLLLPEIVDRFQSLGISLRDTLNDVAACKSTPNATFLAPDGEIIDFDPIAYRARRSDVAAAGLGPLFHFAKLGLDEERDARKSAAV